MFVTSSLGHGVIRKRFPMKTMSGRGRKRPEWVQFVYEYMDTEFERLCELGVKVRSPILMDVAVYALRYDDSSPGSSTENSSPTIFCIDTDSFPVL